MPRPPLVAVCGAGEASPGEAAAAEEVGRRLAQAGAAVVCGGLGGVMAAVARGVRREGGVSVGLLPGWDADAAAADLTVALPTGLDELRNALIIRAARGVIAIGGAYGTLTEVAFALRLGRPVVGLGSWEVRRHGAQRADPGITVAADPAEAVALLLARI